MNIDSLKSDEQAILSLRSLYSRYGYLQYKMSKFEEYDLYVRNKDFLVSDNIITFTDTDGKLMALKPDVTLSIIKNTKDMPGCVHKVYYNENVYRVSKGTNSYKEIMQTGLECMGDIDDYCIYEMLMLASRSLDTISSDYVLDISHLDIVSAVIDSMEVSDKARRELLLCIGEKNIHGISDICQREAADAAELKKLVSTYGSPEKVIPMLESIECVKNSAALSSLKKITNLLSENGFGDKIRIDFSVINHMGYYNGFVFKGFINGVSSGILSGGQYDRLMHKMGRSSGAIGFAVYLDMLERLTKAEDAYDVDAVILYDDSSDLKALNDAVRLFTIDGRSVTVQKQVPEKIKYRQLLRLNERGVEIIENNA
ncbi:MAG: ATP phosphoribosyltransferase regulatory subunit [Clostridia bacterium]|nr:ATP phosphoribosyltransferase regulatory subunit [Clostridia bacterium]